MTQPPHQQDPQRQPYPPQSTPPPPYPAQNYPPQHYPPPPYPPRPYAHQPYPQQVNVQQVNLHAPQRSVTRSRTRTSHGLHLFLTIVTGGVWGIFVWFPLTLWHKLGPRKRAVTYYR